MIRNFILALLMKAVGKNEVLVDVISTPYKNICYSINTDTQMYNFWEYEFGSFPKLIESNLTKEEALFKLMLVGGVE